MFSRVLSLLVLAALVVALDDCRADRLCLDCPPSLRPAMKRWVDWRTGQGHSVAWVGPTTPRAPAPRDGVRTVLILVGDGEGSGRPPGRVPAEVIGRYGPESSILSDHPFGEWFAADTIARLPFNDAAGLAAYLDRVIAREQRAPGWGDQRFQIVAGVGGFSPLIDATIESVARRLIGDRVSPAQAVTLRRVNDDPVKTTDRGGVWVWLGHGLPDRLPGVTPNEVAALSGGADFAVLLACYAGAFTHSTDCVAEQLLKLPNGPIAVVASTRVSMPYGNARLGVELLSGMNARPEMTIGRVLAEARRASLPETLEPDLKGLDSIAALLGAARGSLPAERRDHARMYHLLGDPCCVVDRSSALSLQGPQRVASGSLITIEGVAPFDGLLRGEFLARSGRGERLREAPRLVRRGERFTVRFDPPLDWQSGRRLVRVGISGRRGFAVGAHEVEKIRPTQARRAAGSPVIR